MKKSTKIAIAVIVFVAIVVIAVVVINQNKHKLEEYIKPEYNYFAMYSVDGKVGVVDKSGKLLIKPEYLDVFIPNPSKAVFICYTNSDSYKFLNSKGEELYKEYEGVTALQTSELNLDFEKRVFRFRKDDKYGLIDYDGKIVVSASYDELTSLKNRPGEILAKKNDKVGVLDASGQVKIELKYDSVVGDEYFTENKGYTEAGYIVGTKGENGFIYGYLNNFGEKVLDVQFESISRVLKYDDSNIYLIVMTNGKKGVYKNSKKIIEQNYQNINYADSSKIFVAKRNTNYGIFNINGKEILPVKYKAYNLAGDYISVENQDGLKELYDVNGNKVSNLNYKSVQASGNKGGYIAIDDNGFYSIITNGETISDNYTYISYAFDNYFIFRNQAGFYGLINIYSGVEIEPDLYTFMLKVDGKDAIEAVTADGVRDIFASNMEKVLSVKDAVIETVDENYTVVHSNSEIYYIDKNGQVVSNLEVYPKNTLFAFQENGKWGYQDKDGSVVIEPIYDLAMDIDEYGFGGIVLDGKWGVMSSSGKVVKDPEFTLDTYYFPTFIGEYLLEVSDTYHCLELK
ncbi:MAG: WG repeat-containing protein [Clostridia bacterium]|nr:WG repeat-containing protein [Clostridia bacterium]